MKMTKRKGGRRMKMRKKVERRMKRMMRMDGRMRRLELLDRMACWWSWCWC